MTGLDSSQIETDNASLHAEELHLQSHNRFPATTGETEGKTKADELAATPPTSGSDPA